MSRVTIVRKGVRHLNLRVRPEGEVVLSVPFDCTDEEIARLLQKREAWIAEKLAFFRRFASPEAREYVSGENMPYLGRNYRLKVIESTEEGVSLQRGYVQLFVKNRADRERKRRLLEGWYRARARVRFAKALDLYIPRIGVAPQAVTIRKMKSRWGSCSPATGRVTLNLRLIEKPTACIEYVALHELAHLVHPNHDRAFYDFLDLHMPDWRERKERLESVSA
jgi:predicted metal-dependent hydrolase